jgi:hypothetical protein
MVIGIRTRKLVAVAVVVPHYEVRFEDGATSFGCRTLGDLECLIKERREFHDRRMRVVGVGTRKTLAEVISEQG